MKTKILFLFLLLGCHLYHEATADPVARYVAKKSASLQKQNTVVSKNGNLKVKVGVVMASGDVKFIAKTPFFLIGKSITVLRDERVSSRLTLSEFLKVNAASDELIQWAENHKEINIALGIGDYRYKELRSAAMVPEFQELIKHYNIQEAYNRCQEANSSRSWDEYYGETDCGNSDLEYLPNLLPDYLKPNGDNYSNYLANHLADSNSKAQTAAKDLIVSVCQTNFNGECVFENIKGGEYWITPLQPVIIGKSVIMWDKKVVIEPNKTTYLELSNDNATQDDGKKYLPSYALLQILENY